MSNLFDRMKLLVQRDKEFRSALYDIMGFYPHNVELYRIAFAHKSQEYKSKKTGDRPLNNERLEFLGDAVLETVVSDIVYHNFKNKREGFLTNTRSKIVSRESLGKLAKDLGIDRLIQSHTNGKAHNSFLAGNAFEALMGAIYLDRGFDYAFRFIEHRIMGSVLDLEGVAHKEVNFKSKLLEWTQKNRIRIDFRDKQSNSQNANDPTFYTTIILEGLYAGDGKGFSKKEAHQNASKEALTRMRREPKFIDEIFLSKEKRTAMEADPCFVLPVIDEIEADIAREEEAAEKARQTKQDKQKAKKKEQPRKQKKANKPSTAEEPATEPVQETPTDTKPASAEAKSASTEAKSGSTKVQPAPISTEDVIPIALEDVTEPAPATAEVPVKTEPAAEIVEEVHTETSEEVPTETHEALQADAPAPEQTAEPQHKKSRRRGRRQNAAGFTNTDPILAETSHRAEKAAKKVEAEKKEKARKQAHKTAKKAAKNIEEAPKTSEEPKADATSSKANGKGEKNTGKGEQITAKGDQKSEVKKKPRRRRKTKAEMPSETPNPEREQAIAAAESAAYNQQNNED